MALIKTIEELKAVIPATAAMNASANLPNVDKAARLHLVPILGKYFYQDLYSKYTDNTASDAEKELIKHIQLPLGAFALLDDLSFMHTLITDNGIRTASDAQFQAAHRWEYKELENGLRNYAADGLEILLAYLFENQGSYPKWTDSKEYKELDSFLIKSGQDFSKHYLLSQPLRTFWKLKPTMDMVEENYLNTLLGRQMLAWIKVKDEILITITGAQVDVKKLLKKAVANLTIKHAAETLAVDFGVEGFTILAFRGSLDDAISDGKVAAGNSDIARKIDAASRDGQNFLNKAAAYLQSIGEGTFGEELKNDIAAAYANSPLKLDPSAEPVSRNNDKRKIFVF